MDSQNGVSALILTPQDRRDLQAALVEAIDTADTTADYNSPQVARWVALINLIEEGNK